MGIIQLLIINTLALFLFVGIPVLIELSQFLFKKWSEITGGKMISSICFWVFIGVTCLSILLGITCIIIVSISSYSSIQEAQEWNIYSHNDDKNIVILTSTDRISIDYFKNRENLHSVQFCSPDTEIETATFAECKELQNITLPYRLKEIKPFTFAYCTELSYIDIPNSVKKIGDRAFLHCVKLREIETWGSIGEEAFSGCTQLSKVTIAGNAKEISERAFFDCKNLKDISLPVSISYIGKEAFSGCESLGSINIPSSVIFIEDEVFAKCLNLTVICQKNSYAEQWCQEHNQPYKIEGE